MHRTLFIRLNYYVVCCIFRTMTLNSLTSLFTLASPGVLPFPTESITRIMGVRNSTDSLSPDELWSVCSMLWWIWGRYGLFLEHHRFPAVLVWSLDILPALRSEPAALVYIVRTICYCLCCTGWGGVVSYTFCLFLYPCITVTPFPLITFTSV